MRVLCGCIDLNTHICGSTHIYAGIVATLHRVSAELGQSHLPFQVTDVTHLLLEPDSFAELTAVVHLAQIDHLDSVPQTVPGIRVGIILLSHILQPHLCVVIFSPLCPLDCHPLLGSLPLVVHLLFSPLRSLDHLPQLDSLPHLLVTSFSSSVSILIFSCGRSLIGILPLSGILVLALPRKNAPSAETLTWPPSSHPRLCRFRHWPCRGSCTSS